MEIRHEGNFPTSDFRENGNKIVLAGQIESKIA
jgi:hypothetical protein